ncbi:hypothetical protein [Thalassorhabdomicrobium marinisediminis]|uniref:hypothetical protein n=1 Tax=Thalassorhabdomicrobium marinisediminis TaxID=2170577 RepID=UPI0024915AA4|nr:hypothetical protein [Thalassorhabdomicrobium marinisediminis]
MIRSGAVASFLVLCAAPAFAQTEEERPLSAIDWLSESVEQPDILVISPRGATQPNRVPDADEAPVTEDATSPDVDVRPLGGPAPRAIGLLGSATTGLPDALWENSEPEVLANLLLAQDIDTLPALQELIATLALARANPPRLAPEAQTFLQARIDKLLDLGALEAAQALLEAAGPDSPEMFRRWFDVSLLTGTENAACRALSDTPHIAPTPAAQIFCLARRGDWPAAALTLNTGLALGDIDTATGDLLTRFLDPDLFDADDALMQPDPITPLTFRMFEAIGEPLPTQGLHRAFAHADLRPNVGWKAQLEAAERLARAGAIAPNTLVGLYTKRQPAASGGVWERARAVAALDGALTANRDPADAVATLWEEATDVGVIVPLAQYYGPRVLAADPAPDVDVFRLLLLSEKYEDAALVEGFAALDPFLAGVARGDPGDARATRAGYALVQSAFAAEPLPDMLDIARDGRSGEAILRTLATLQQGIDGDEQAFRSGFATLRALGLEDYARRIALQYLLLT